MFFSPYYVKQMCCHVQDYYFTIELAKVSVVSAYSGKIADTFRLIRKISRYRAS